MCSSCIINLHRTKAIINCFEILWWNIFIDHRQALDVCCGGGVGEGWVGGGCVVEVFYMRAMKYRKMQQSCFRIHGAETNWRGIDVKNIGKRSRFFFICRSNVLFWRQYVGEYSGNMVWQTSVAEQRRASILTNIQPCRDFRYGTLLSKKERKYKVEETSMVCLYHSAAQSNENS